MRPHTAPAGTRTCAPACTTTCNRRRQPPHAPAHATPHASRYMRPRISPYMHTQPHKPRTAPALTPPETPCMHPNWQLTPPQTPPHAPLASLYISFVRRLICLSFSDEFVRTEPTLEMDKQRKLNTFFYVPNRVWAQSSYFNPFPLNFYGIKSPYIP